MSSALSCIDAQLGLFLSRLEGNPDLDTISIFRTRFEEMPENDRKRYKNLSRRVECRIDELTVQAQKKIVELIQRLEEVNEETDFFSITTVIPTIRTLKKIENIQMNDAKRRQAPAIAKINEVIRSRIQDVMDSLVSEAARTKTLADVKVVEDHKIRLMEFAIHFHACLEDKIEHLQQNFNIISWRIKVIKQANSIEFNKELSAIKKDIRNLKPVELTIPAPLQGLTLRIAALIELSDSVSKNAEVTKLKIAFQTYIRENLTLRDQKVDALTIDDLKKIPTFIKELTTFYQAASKIMDHESTQILKGMIDTLKKWGLTIQEEHGLKKK